MRVPLKHKAKKRTVPRKASSRKLAPKKAASKKPPAEKRKVPLTVSRTGSKPTLRRPLMQSTEGAFIINKRKFVARRIPEGMSHRQANRLEAHHDLVTETFNTGMSDLIRAASKLKRAA